MKYFFLFFSLIIYSNSSRAQSYIRKDTAINLFSINDTIKYFEVITHSMSKESVMCGILSKMPDSTFILNYADGYKPCIFQISFKNKSTIDLSYLNKEDCYFSRTVKGRFILSGNIPYQKSFEFSLRYRIFYYSTHDIHIKCYEYPNFGAKFTIVNFKKGDTIEERRRVGVYYSYNPEKEKSWGLYMCCNGKLKGWFLLSDVYNSFKFSGNYK